MSTPHVTPAQAATVVARRRSLFLRVHFWAALIASPFAILAALTGLLYVFTPQVEAVLHGHLDRVVPAGQARPLDDIVRAAGAVAPAGQHLKNVVVPGRDDASVQVVFSPARHALAAAAGGEHAGHGAPAAAAVAAPMPARAGHGDHAGHAGHGAHGVSPDSIPAPVANVTSTATAGDRLPRGTIVYVDPYTARVLGSQGEMERFGMWSKRLHSSLLQGDGWRWMIELSASWLMVMLLTGIWLWWPRGQARALPDGSARGRSAWKQWHGFLGVALSVMSLAILSTGLTWSKHAGDQIRSFRDAIGQAPPAPPKGLQSVATGQEPLAWDAILQAARRTAPGVTLLLTPPRNAQGVWRIASSEQTEPGRKVNLVLDAYSGRALFQAGWEQQTAFGKATAIGIPFHRGEFGVWNQVLLFLFGAGVLFSLASGWVMFVLRRRQGSAVLPRLLPGAWTSLPLGGWIAGAVLLAAMPLFALSAAGIVLLEIALVWRERTARMVLAQG
ncbi:PepSY-associated TM helix domain-containing protein [Ramlibacter sp. AN1133]|uniref:PepSY-associated TM helix domain-containing protein n=1 Tax=Ramlibacter sp. AN1133 TaxID=3133429 RepID=UPI0030BAE886